MCACSHLTELQLLLQPEYLDQIANSLMESSTEKQDVKDLASQPLFLSLESLTVPRSAWLKLSPLFPNLRSLQVDVIEPRYCQAKVLLDYKSLAKAYPRLNKLHTEEQSISLVVEGEFLSTEIRISLTLIS